MPPKEKTVIAPPEGWQEQTLYLVEVSFKETNPVHRAYLEVGFLRPNGDFGGCTELFSNSYENVQNLSVIKSLHYLKFIRVLCNDKDECNN